jgi:hypothetical protein
MIVEEIIISLQNAIKSNHMATNGKSGDNRRHGAIRGRSQTYNPKTGIWIKRDSSTGRFMDGKTSSPDPFKGVRKEK